MKDLPSQEELLAGRMKDGSRPPLYSTELYDKHVEDGFGRPLPPQLREKTEGERTALELKIAIEERRLRNYNRIEAAGNYLIDLGYEILARDDASPPGNLSTDQTAGAGESEPAAQDEGQKGSDPLAHESEAGETGGTDETESPAEPVSSDADDHSDTDDGDSPRKRGQSPAASPGARILELPSPRRPRAKPVRGGQAVVPPPQTSPPDNDEELERRAERTEALVRDVAAGVPGRSRKSAGNLTAKDAPNLIYTGARLLASVTDKRAECANNLVEMTMQQDLKEAFYWDRAHAVVASTLLHLDAEFEKVGFGSWMPFKFPDQWLMFCGVMRRVLAANGLIYAENPDQYRKLLDEADPAVPKIQNLKDRINWWNTPRNWSTLWSNRGALNMEILKQRLTDEVWDPTTEFGGTRAPPKD